MDDNETVGQDILKTLRRLVIATVILYVALAGLFVLGYVTVHNQRVELERTVDQTTTALCSLRGDLEARVRVSREFLEDNPNGIPGITPQVIRDSINGRLRTIEALESLACPKEGGAT